jgi:hypothetical protein
VTTSSWVAAQRSAPPSPSPRLRGEGRDEGRPLARRLRVPPPLTLALSPQAGRGDMVAIRDVWCFAYVANAEIER